MANLAVSNTFAASTLIQSALVNQNYTDIVTYVNARNGGGTSWDALTVSGASSLAAATLTGILTLPTGSAAAPSLHFTEAATGIFRRTTNAISFGSNGTQIAEITGSGLEMNVGTVLMDAAGTASAPAIQFTETNTGLYRLSANALGITTNGTKAIGISNAQVVDIGNTKLSIGGNVVLPILQIVTGTSTTLFNTTSSTFQTTNLSVTITPKFSTSKIYIIATGSMGASSTSVVQATLARGGTNILGSGGGVAWNMSVNGVVPMTVQAYDSPATTSATTYAVQVRNFNGTSTVNFGGGTAPEITQYITAVEIAQ